MMGEIIRVHFPDLDQKLAEAAVNAFFRVRDFSGIEKKPATRELINWIRAMSADPDFNPKNLDKGDIPFLGVLFKKSQDFARAATTLARTRLF
jgi:hypothetical protein